MQLSVRKPRKRPAAIVPCALCAGCRCGAGLLFFALTTLVGLSFPRVFTSEAVAAEPSTQAIQSLIEEARNGEISVNELAESLVSIALRYPNLEDSLSGIRVELPGFEEAFGPVLLSSAESALIADPPEESKGLRTLAQELLPADDDHRRRVERLYALAEKLEQLGSSGDIDALIELTYEYQGPEEKNVLTARLGESVQARAKSYAEEANAFEALKKLAEVDALAGNKQVVTLGNQALLRLAAQVRAGERTSEEWTLDQPVVQGFLKKLFAEDARAKRAMASLYEWYAKKLLANDDTVRAQHYYEQVLTLRPDPNEANDELRWGLVEAAGSEQSRSFARERLEELKESGKLSSSRKISLLFNGYYGNGPFVAFGLVLLLIVAAIALLLLRPRRAGIGPRKVVEGRGRHPAGYRAVTDSDDEYSRLLAIFGLEENASESQIKRAFRNAVKEAHPDMKTHTADNQKFQELRQSYDRIMEIRGAWFGGKR